MGWLRSLWHYLAASDPTLNADQKISRWVNIGAAGTLVTSVGGGILGSIFAYPWAGVAIGLALWFAALYAIAKLVPRSQPTIVATNSRQAQEEFSGDKVRVPTIEQGDP